MSWALFPICSFSLFFLLISFRFNYIREVDLMLHALLSLSLSLSGLFYERFLSCFFLLLLLHPPSSLTCSNCMAVWPFISPRKEEKLISPLLLGIRRGYFKYVNERERRRRRRPRPVGRRDKKKRGKVMQSWQTAWHRKMLQGIFLQGKLPLTGFLLRLYFPPSRWMVIFKNTRGPFLHHKNMEPHMKI